MDEHKSLKGGASNVIHDPVIGEQVAPTAELRWKDGKLQQKFWVRDVRQFTITTHDRAEWRDVPTEN